MISLVFKIKKALLNTLAYICIATALVMFILPLPCFASKYRVLRVVDGDTIDIEYRGKKERIRMLNVDTPESVHPDKGRNTRMGHKASAYAKKHLSGQQVSLEFEGRKRGRYGRLLAYVILDGKNFNLELVKNGWSPYYTKYGQSQRYHSSFRSAETMARARGLNIWAEGDLTDLPLTSPGTLSSIAGLKVFHGNVKSQKFHNQECRYFNCKSCTRIFPSRQSAVTAGFSPCRLCSP